MEGVRAGSRELKARLGHYIRLVRAGQEVTITDRGEPVARIVGLEPQAELEERAMAGVRAGLASWSGRKPRLSMPEVSVRDGGSIAALVIEGRE